MKVYIFGLLAALSVAAVNYSEAATDKVVCYYGSWANYRQGNGKFQVEHIDPHLCTTVIYTFVGLREDGTINVLDPYLDLEENYGLGAYKRLQKLKEKNPELKTLIAIGGWNEGSQRYSTVMENDALRAKFVQEAVNFTLKYKFDGFDLDWEYPNQRGGREVDVKNHVKVLKELRAAFDQHGLILTAAVASAEFSASQSYNIAEVSKYLDYIHLMTYDMHGAWEKFTGHNSPLYPSSVDKSDLQKQLNIVACVKYWLSKGADPAKIILGIGTYGRSFSLNNPSVNGVGAPADNPGNAGPHTRTQGVIGYNEIIELEKEGGWTTVWDDEQQVPHMIKGNQWIGFDNPASIKLKVDFAKSQGLGGVMIWSIETDDFNGLSGSKYPLLTAINRALGNNVTPEPVTTIRPPSSTSTTTPYPGTGTTGNPGNNSICKTEGFVRDKEDCGKFYNCVKEDGGFKAIEFHCSEGLVFDTTTFTCNYPANVNCTN